MTQTSLPSLSWQALRPELKISDFKPVTQGFWDLQEDAAAALNQFLRNRTRSLLVLKAEDQMACAQALQEFIRAQQPKNLPVAGVRYEVEQADSFSFARVNVSPAQSVEDNFAAKLGVTSALYFDQYQLFGSLVVHAMSKDILLNAGLVHQTNQGVLILALAPLLADFSLWQRLKHLLLTQRFDWYSAHPFKDLPCKIPSYDLNLKVILLGSRAELAMFAEAEEQLYPLADYAEINSYLSLSEPVAQLQWANYVYSFAQQHYQLNLDLPCLNYLYQELVRESEDRWQIHIAPYRLQAILSGVAAIASDHHPTVDNFIHFFAQQAKQASFLREQAYGDILHEQVYIATDDEVVGQINALSVIEYTGVPLAFGEPSRMSCLVKFGDGEVIDIERKNELAGNLHGKGMMIAEACLANILALPSQLPFSASLVFEQSYAEIDGDSASLAAFCLLVSALSDLPLPQSIAVTGTIDQFGLTHAVGGVNAKVEGFFAICQSRGLNGKQGVIIPNAVVNQLCLSQQVVDSVKAQQFSIWAVEDVHQACAILFQRDLLESDGDNSPLLNSDRLSLGRLIQQRIEQYSEQQKQGFWQRLLMRG